MTTLFINWWYRYCWSVGRNSSKHNAEFKQEYQAKLDTAIEENKTIKDSYNKARVVNEVNAAVTKGLAEGVKVIAGAEATLVDKLVSQIDIDSEGNLFIRNAEGEPRLSAESSMDRMGIDEAYKLFAADKANAFLFDISLHL